MDTVVITEEIEDEAEGEVGGMIVEIVLAIWIVITVEIGTIEDHRISEMSLAGIVGELVSQHTTGAEDYHHKDEAARQRMERETTEMPPRALK